MASVLVDLEDISYIDDITDEDFTNSEEENSQTAKKRKKNTLVGEKLLIDPNDKLVRELRQERKENKKAMYSISEGENQTESDLERLQIIIKEQEKQKVLQELREERAKLNTEFTEERYRLEDNVHEKKDSTDSVNKTNLYKPKQYSMTKENNDKMNKDIENKDIKRKSQENVSIENDITQQSNEDEVQVNLESDVRLDKTAEFKDETDAHDEVFTEFGESDHNFTDKSKLVKSDRKPEFRSKGKRQRSPSVGKENINVEISPNTTENADKNMFNDENENDTTLLLQQKISDISDKDKSDFNGAKPKLFTRRDMQLKELNLDLCPNIETSRQSAKGKAAMKKKTKAQLEVPEQNLHSNIPDIKILVTNEDGREMIAHMSESTTGTSTETWNSNFINKNELSSPSNATTSSDTGRSTPLNYLRKMSVDNEGKKSNHLLEQQELYKQQKAKPFQNFTKIKCGFISTGIEGDSKRSYIKTMTMMPDMKLVLFDKKNKCLKLFDKDFNPLDKISITSKYCGLAAVFDETVAATLPSTRKLQFYHINNDTNKISRERTHPVEGEFYSITYHHHRLYMLHRVRTHHFTDSDDWEIKRLNINKNTDEMKTLRTFSPGHKDCNLLANDHGLYITNRLENEVLMLKHDGTFQYRHKTELSLPVGITSDRFGNIYVCGGSVTSFIEVIKPDLRRYRMIYKKTSSNPVALCFNKEENTLYFSDQIIGKVVKYKIQHNGTVQGLMRSMLISTSSQDS